MSLVIRGRSAVRGTLAETPGDKSVSHRALLMAAIATGVSTVRGLSTGDDVARTVAVVKQLGADVTISPTGVVTVSGGRLIEPTDVLDHGNSGTSMRLTAGLLAGHPMFAVLTGDRYLKARPMDRIIAPLRDMGATIDGRRGGSLGPLAIRGGQLHGINYTVPVPSAQVKSAVLLAGLRATGRTEVSEPIVTRRHTEELLREFGADVAVDERKISIMPSQLQAANITVPGDPSQAAFWVVAGIIAGSDSVVIENLYLQAERTGFLDVLAALGAKPDIDLASGRIVASPSRLEGTKLQHLDPASFIDEVPILAVAAATATGVTVFDRVGELRLKESDRIASTTKMLSQFGVWVSESKDSFTVTGRRRLTPAEIDPMGDHRIAMASAIAALCADGETVIRGWESVATSYPEFATHLNRLTGDSSTARVVAGPV